MSEILKGSENYAGKMKGLWCATKRFDIFERFTDLHQFNIKIVYRKENGQIYYLVDDYQSLVPANEVLSFLEL